MPKQVGDVIYLDSADSSGVETEYETIFFKVNGAPHIKRRKLYKVRYPRSLPRWMVEKEKEEEKEDPKSSNHGKIVESDPVQPKIANVTLKKEPVVKMKHVNA